MSIEWILVKGGISKHGDRNVQRNIMDLLWSRTLLTLDQIGQGQYEDGNLPITGRSYTEAKMLASEFGARLPSHSEWEWMASGFEMRMYPWGNASWDETRANILPLGISKTTPVGNFINGATPEGILDVAGNLWEFTSSRIHKSGIIIKGGSYNSKELHIRNKFWNAVPMEIKSYGLGIRLVKAG